MAWLTTLLVCCIVPIDVYSTLASKNPEAITILWDVSFWSTQLLTWALIPVYMGYVDAGEFTWSGKMMASIKFNAVFFVLMVRAMHAFARLTHACERCALLHDALFAACSYCAKIKASCAPALMCVVSIRCSRCQLV